jgi:hypothetical protein
VPRSRFDWLGELLLDHPAQDLNMTSHPHRHVLRAALVAAIVALLGSFLALSPSGAAVSGSISGTVTGPDGPVEAGVNLYVLEGSDWNFSDFSVTDAGTGNYTFSNVAAGTYRLGFEHSDFAFEYFDNRTLFEVADDIEVAEGQAVTGKDAQLAVGGRIGGVVKRPGGAPLPDVAVRVYQLIGGTFTPLHGSDENYAVSTNDDGAFTVSQLQAGIYRVEFVDIDEEYASEYNGNASTLAAAPNITVVSGRKSITNATLLRGGTMSGTLHASNGDPLSGMDVTAYRLVNGELETYGLTSDFGQNDQSNSAGQYLIGGLPAGTFRLRFDDFEGEKYGTEYFDGSSTLEDADNIAVTAGQDRSGLDAVLEVDPAPPGPGISGTVLAGNGSPLEGIQVSATPLESGNDCEISDDCTATTAVDGTYLIPVPSGEYFVHFSDPAGAYEEENFDNQPPGIADSVTVGDGVRGGVDARLALRPPGRISGTVTLTDGSPARNVRVDLAVDVGPFFQLERAVRTRSNGTYAIGGLDPGTYRLGFFPDDDLTYADEYYNNVRTFASARNILLAEGQTLAGRSARLERNGSVSGTVTTPDGKPVAGIDVVAGEGPTFDRPRSDETNRDGEFVITQAPGTYRLAINAGDDDGYNFSIRGAWTGEFYNDSPTFAGADEFTVRAGRTTQGLNVGLGYFVPPTNLSVTSVTPTTVTLGWTKTAGVHQYKVRYVPTAGGPANILTVGDVDTTEVTGLSPGVAYNFKVAAYVPEYVEILNEFQLEDRISRYSPVVEGTTAP